MFHALPALKSRAEMLRILENEIYGTVPPAPETMHFTVKKEYIPHFCAGHATCDKVIAEGVVNGRPFAFPFYTVLPNDGKRHPFFIHINFRPDLPDRYQPTEELIDNGFAVLTVCYNEVTRDNNDFTDGVTGALFPDGRRAPTDAGKLAIWAWAAHRVMDYAERLSDTLDLSRAAVCGHSRLGKTALLAAATDDRFAFAYSNDSGCAGAAITRGKQGERVRDITTNFPFWFCENYTQYADREEAMPFDQHFLVAAIAPRRVLIGSAAEDLWADPAAEQRCCVAASSAFDIGFLAPDRKAAVGDAFLDGDIGYHLRDGAHYFSRADWLQLIRFVALHS